jgi:hypothetical protein
MNIQTNDYGNQATPKDPLPVTNEDETQNTTSNQVLNKEKIKIYQDKDKIEQYFETNQFTGGRSSEYTSDIGKPSLPVPDERPPINAPLDMFEQKIVRNYFVEQLLIFLKEQNLSPEETEQVQNSFTNGAVLTDPKLQTIAAQVKAQATQKTIEEAHLPSTWTIESANPVDWTAIPIAPYQESEKKAILQFYHDTAINNLTSYAAETSPRLTEENIRHLTDLLENGGKVPSHLKAAYTSIVNSAKATTQTKFGLPISWTKTASLNDEWVPVQSSIVNPISTQEAQESGLVQNISIVINDLEKATIGLKDYIGIIADTIREMKQLLQEMQLKDSKITKKVSAAKFEEIKAREERAELQAEENKKAEKKQNKMKKFSKVMKYLGPALSIASTIIGVLVLVVFSPVAPVLLIAAIAVGGLLAAYSIADSAIGLTPKLMKAFNEMLPNASDKQRLLAKILIVTTVILVSAVLGGAAAFAVAASTVGGMANMAAQLALQVIKQVSIQAITMAVTTSGVLTELIEKGLSASGITDEKTLLILKSILTIVVMVAVSVIASSAKGIVQGVRTLVTTEFSVTVAAIAAAIAKIPQNVATSVSTAIKELQTNFETFANEIMQILNKIANLSLRESAMEVVAGVKELFKEIFSPNVLFGISKALDMSAVGVQVIDSVYRATILIQIAKIMEKQGDIKAFEEMLMVLIEMLEKLLTSIQTGYGEGQNMIELLSKLFTNMFKSNTQALGKLSNIQG